MAHFDLETSIEETMMALDTAVRSGRAPYAGISSYSAECEQQGMGMIVFTALAQGLLTDRYLGGVPEDSRAARDDSTLTGLDDDELAEIYRYAVDSAVNLWAEQAEE